ncbi:MAG: hypothetical protein WAO76_15265 [Georgfuchsia sp.]
MEQHNCFSLHFGLVVFLLLALSVLGDIAHAEPSASEKAGFIITPGMRAAKNKGVKRLRKLVSLLYQDTEAAAAEYLADHGNPYSGGNIPVSGEIPERLDIHGVPATFVVSPEGNILQRFQGTLGSNGQEALSKFFSEGN